MPVDKRRFAELQEKVKRLEALLRQVPAAWARCLREGTLTLGPLHSAARAFLKLVYQIEKELPVQPAAQPAARREPMKRLKVGDRIRLTACVNTTLGIEPGDKGTIVAGPIVRDAQEPYYLVTMDEAEEATTILAAGEIELDD